MFSLLYSSSLPNELKIIINEKTSTVHKTSTGIFFIHSTIRDRMEDSLTECITVVELSQEEFFKD